MTGRPHLVLSSALMMVFVQSARAQKPGLATAQQVFAHAIEQVNLTQPGSIPFAYRMNVSLKTDLNVPLSGHFLYAWNSPDEWVRILVAPPITFSEGTHAGQPWLYLSSSAAIPIAVQTEDVLLPWSFQLRDDAHLKKPQNRKVSGQWLKCVDESEKGLPESVRYCFDPGTGLLLLEDSGSTNTTRFADFTSWNGHEFPKVIDSSKKYAGEVHATLDMLGPLADAKLGSDIFQPPTEARPWDFCDPPNVFLPPRLNSQQLPAVSEDVPRPLEVTVMLHAIVDTSGAVQDPVISPTKWPAMDASVLNVIRQWKFEPATCNGRAIATYRVPFMIEIHSIQ